MRIALLITACSVLCAQKAALSPMTSGSLSSSDAVFIFQDNFWINLHHFVRGESRRRSLHAPFELPLSALNANERAAWEGALDAYVELAQLSLISDERLVRIDNTLAKVTDRDVLRSNGMEPKIVTALNAAAPVYRAHRWEEDRRENDRWIAANEPEISQHAVAVKKAIASVLQIVPPSGPILVDLARDIGPTLAYTTEGPDGTAGHTLVAPQKNSDLDVVLDTLLHEISHTMDNQITREVDDEAKRQGVKIPADLWHAITLYTTGEIVKRELGRQGGPAYRPDASRKEMFKRNGWEEMLTDLEKYWQPYLDGKVPFQTALHELVRNAAR